MSQLRIRATALCLAALVGCRGGLVVRGAVMDVDGTPIQVMFSPEPVTQQQATTITFWTLGTPCDEPARTDGRWDGDVFVIEPWDRRSGEACILELAGIHHTITTVFPRAGSATIYLVGRRLTGAQPDTVVHQLTVN